MINYERLGDFLAYHGRLPETKKEYAMFALYQGGKRWKTIKQKKNKHDKRRLIGKLKHPHHKRRQHGANYGRSR